MKMANYKYYQEYLRPDALVANSLDIVKKLDTNAFPASEGGEP